MIRRGNIMIDAYLEDMHWKQSKDRRFIPLFSVYDRQALKTVMRYCNEVSFNYFQLRSSKYYKDAKSRGIRDAFNINDDIRIFLTSTAKDEQLTRFYDSGGAEEYRSDVQTLGVDLAMGPDWFTYEDQSLETRERCLQKSIDLNQKCIDIETVLPNIHGTNFQEMQRFIETFKEQGKLEFVMPGREYLINRGHRTRDQKKLAALTSSITRLEEVKLIVTGCSSPKLMFEMPDVAAFCGFGWVIQSRYRRLIYNKTYLHILNPLFECKDNRCCGTYDKEELVQPTTSSIRALHNFLQIDSQINEVSTDYQGCLMIDG